MRNAWTRAGAAVALAAALALAGCKTEVYHGLTEAEANEIIVALDSEGIEAEKQIDTGGGKKGLAFKIVTRAEDAVYAKRVLLQNQLPRPREVTFADAFAAPSMIPTETEEKTRFLTALQGELATTLEKHDGVVDASVHLVLPEANPLEAAKELTQARASVLIKYQGRSEKLAEAEQTSLEHKKYKQMLIDLADDLRKLRAMLLGEVADANRVENRALDNLNAYFTERRGDDAETKEARKQYEIVRQAAQKRGGTLDRIAAMPKIKDLDKALLDTADELEASLPYRRAAVRSIIAGGVKRLSPDDVAVEFTRVVPKPIPPRPPKAGFWQDERVFLGLLSVTAAMALGLSILTWLLMQRGRDLQKARQQAASAAAAKLGGSVMGMPPGAPPAG